LAGGLSDRIGRRKPLYIAGLLTLTGAWGLVILVPALPVPLLIGLLLLAGLASGSMVVGFAFIKESVPLRLGGTASGLVNMGTMTGPMILQPAVGMILDWTWQGKLVDGIKVYGFDAFRLGFSLMLAWAVVSSVLIFFTKETAKDGPKMRCKMFRLFVVRPLAFFLPGSACSGKCPAALPRGSCCRRLTQRRRR